MDIKSGHLTEKDILMYFAEKLTFSQKIQFENHIIICPSCGLIYIRYEEVLENLVFQLLYEIKKSPKNNW